MLWKPKLPPEIAELPISAIFGRFWQDTRLDTPPLDSAGKCNGVLTCNLSESSGSANQIHTGIARGHGRRVADLVGKLLAPVIGPVHPALLILTGEGEAHVGTDVHYRWLAFHS
jgi:hypothetical protein